MIRINLLPHREAKRKQKQKAFVAMLVLGALLGGAIVTEGIFNILGVGGYIFTGIRNRDGIAVVGAVTALVIVYLVMNLIVDLLYGALDPRISHD